MSKSVPRQIEYCDDALIQCYCYYYYHSTTTTTSTSTTNATTTTTTTATITTTSTTITTSTTLTTTVKTALLHMYITDTISPLVSKAVAGSLHDMTLFSSRLHAY